MAVQVGWLFSLIRSGSSAAAYSAAAPWGVPVADEVFGPWDRTVAPYHFPPVQKELVREFKAAGFKLRPNVVALANELFEQMGRETGRVLSKCPHLMFTPEELAEAFPEHRAVYLIRNPLHRLNSHYHKGWQRMIEADNDLRVYKVFAERWLASPHRVVYDDLRKRPREFFRTLYEGWGWSYTEEDLDKAAAYRARSYHTSSKEVAPEKDTQRVDSERELLLPREVVDLYLNDPVVRPLMEQLGWPTRRSAYTPGLATRVLARLRRTTGRAAKGQGAR